MELQVYRVGPVGDQERVYEMSIKDQIQESNMSSENGFAAEGQNREGKTEVNIMS